MKITGHADVRTVLIDGRMLDPKPSQAVWNHSPDGFNWGYGGSGPAQLALAILLFVGVDADAAVHLHQPLKRDLVEKQLPQGQSFETDFDIDAWLARQRETDRRLAGLLDDLIPFTFTASELMALKDLVLEHLLCPNRTAVYIDVLRNVETTPEELLELLTRGG